MLPSTERSDCLCAHNAHLSVRRLGEYIYGLYCSLFIIFNKFHWGKRKAGKFFPLGLCSFLCSTNLARDRESCFTRLTGCHANALVSLSLSGWSPVAVENLSLTLDLGLGLTRCYLTVLSEISVDQMRQKNCETWRSIPRYVHKYVEELYSFAPGWDCFNNFDVITSQQSVLSLCLESLKWTIFLVFSFFSVLRFSLSRIARQAFVICVHLNELQYFIFKRRSQRCLEAFEEVFSLVFSARHSGMTTLKLNFPAICRLWNSNRHKRSAPTHHASVPVPNPSGLDPAVAAGNRATEQVNCQIASHLRWDRRKELCTFLIHLF